MVWLAVALQLSVVQLQPITPQQTYDVDLEVVRGGDTLPMPPLRLADGIEGRVMLSQTAGPSLLLRTTVRQEKATGCHTLTVGIGQMVANEAETIFVPRMSGTLCGVEVIRLVGEEHGGPTVVARVRPLPLRTELKPPD